MEIAVCLKEEMGLLLAFTVIRGNENTCLPGMGKQGVASGTCNCKLLGDAGWGHLRSTLCYEPAFLGSSSGPFWILLQGLFVKALPAASLLPHFTSATRKQGYGSADVGIKYRARGGWDIVFGLAVQGYSPPRDLKAAGHRASIIIKQRAVDSGIERTSSYAVQGPSTKDGAAAGLAFGVGSPTLINIIKIIPPGLTSWVCLESYLLGGSRTCQVDKLTIRRDFMAA